MVEIIIKTDDPEIKSKERIIAYLLMDALYEFQSHRGPSPQAYVEKRYPGDSVYSGEARQKKIEEVGQRIHLANVLHHAMSFFRIEWL